MKILNVLQTYQLLGAISLRSPFGQRDHAMVRLALLTGLRVAELAGLNCGHVAVGGVAREYLDLPAGLTKYHCSRVVPLCPGARRAVGDLLEFNRLRGFACEAESALLQNRFHQRVTVRAIQRLVEGYRKKAELDVRATPHTLRHSMATNFLRHSHDIDTLSEALGHRRIETTKVYRHFSNEDRGEAFHTFPDPRFPG